MKKKIVVIVVVLVLITLSVLGYMNYFNSPAVTTTYSGTIEGTELPVQPELGGRIVNLPVREGQIIKAGDIVTKPDDSQAKFSLDTTKRQQTQAQAKLNDLLEVARVEEIRRLEYVVTQAKANLAALEPSLKFEEDNLATNQKLYEGGAISKQVVDA